MSTDAEARYIVHLNIPAIGLDPGDALREALEQVTLGGPGNLTYSVEEVENSTRLFAVPTPHPDSTRATYRAWGAKCRTKHNTYPNEFLG